MEQSPSSEANSHSVQKLPAFYGMQGAITLFTTACHWSLSGVTGIQFTTSHPISLRSILILSSHLRLGIPNGLFPSGFSNKIRHNS